MRKGVEAMKMFAAAVALGLGMGMCGAQDVPAMAKDAKPSFDVATIKQTDPNDQSRGFHTRGHRISIENMPVINMIMFAYSVHAKQVVDGPAWLSETRYDVDGVPDVAGEPNLAQYQEMVRRLLEERFALRFKREEREMPIYAIRVAKGGVKIAKTKATSELEMDQTGNGTGTGQSMRFTANTMDDFALGMQYSMNRPVVNQTKLPGRFDFTLKWTTDESKVSEADAAPGLFTAVQEQLGLKLEATNGMAEVLVVEKVERPSAN